MTRHGFTLIELLVVMGIMGLLGTVSVGGYRAMQRGMEERGTMQNVNQFIRTAYQRAQIDRQPVAVYFWNELLREETEYDPPVIVGRAVAVRRAGRITATTGSYLCDEFGDLRFMRLTKDEGDEDEGDVSGSGSSTGGGMYLYHLEDSDSGFSRSVVSQTTKRMSPSRERLLATGGEAQIESYAFVVINPGGVTWKRGDAYGFEFAEIQLPHNFIFGSTYPTSASSPTKDVEVLRFKVSGNSGSGSQSGTSGAASIDVCSLRPNASGELHAEKVATSDSPTKNL
jgi:prepilin-type N-terminal cleavage/methylation domain-containing protein